MCKMARRQAHSDIVTVCEALDAALDSGLPYNALKEYAMLVLSDNRRARSPAAVYEALFSGIFEPHRRACRRMREWNGGLGSRLNISWKFVAFGRQERGPL